MSHQDSSLPDRWIERIWSVMRANYGATFDRQWECPAGADPVAHVSEMKTNWGRELRGFQQSPNAISYALEHLPEFPPSLPQFKALCIRRPDMTVKQLAAPPVDSEVVAKAVAVVKRIGQREDRDWARALQAREQRGDKLTITQKDMWRAALKNETAAA
jgi:hypothetical protein